MKKGIYPYNDKGQRHGYWEVYWSDGDIAFKRYYLNGKLSGYEEINFTGKYMVNFNL